MTGLECIYRRNNNFVFRRIEGETILVPIHSHVADMDCIYSLNSVGALVWEHMDGATDLKTILELLTRDYAVSDQEAARDLLAFVKDMQTISAIESVPGCPERPQHARKPEQKEI
jgi:hypothetical protein